MNEKNTKIKIDLIISIADQIDRETRRENIAHWMEWLAKDLLDRASMSNPPRTFEQKPFIVQFLRRKYIN